MSIEAPVRPDADAMPDPANREKPDAGTHLFFSLDGYIPRHNGDQSTRTNGSHNSSLDHADGQFEPHLGSDDPTPLLDGDAERAWQKYEEDAEPFRQETIRQLQRDDYGGKYWVTNKARQIFNRPKRTEKNSGNTNEPRNAPQPETGPSGSGQRRTTAPPPDSREYQSRHRAPEQDPRPKDEVPIITIGRRQAAARTQYGQSNHTPGNSTAASKHTGTPPVRPDTRSASEPQERQRWTGKRLSDFTPHALAVKALTSIQTRNHAPQTNSETATRRIRLPKAVRFAGAVTLAAAAGYASYKASPYAAEAGSSLLASLFGNGEQHASDTADALSSGSSAGTAEAHPDSSMYSHPSSDLSADTQHLTLGEHYEAQLPAENTLSTPGAETTPENVPANTTVVSDAVGQYTGNINSTTSLLEGTPLNTIALELAKHGLDWRDIPLHEFQAKADAVLEQNGLERSSVPTTVKAHHELEIDLTIFEDYLPLSDTDKQPGQASDQPDLAAENEDDDRALSSTPAPPEPSPEPAPAAADSENVRQPAASENLNIPLAVTATGAVLGVTLFAGRNLYNKKINDYYSARVSPAAQPAFASADNMESTTTNLKAVHDTRNKKGKDHKKPSRKSNSRKPEQRSWPWPKPQKRTNHRPRHTSRKTPKGQEQVAAAAPT